MKTKEEKTKKTEKKHRLLKAVLAVICAAAAVVIIINLIVVISTSRFILTADEAKGLEADCAMVLGCSVRPDGSLSAMLEDRVLTGVELYQNGAGKKLLMSGDHGQVEYDEVNTMKEYAVLKGVPAKDVLLDHAGFSTYESMFRSVKIFKVKKLIISTQAFHLNRAVYDARRMGIDAYGVKADKRNYNTIAYSRLRELAARCKDFLWCIFKPEPTYLGDAIPINSSNGSDTDDREQSTGIKPFVELRTEIITEKTTGFEFKKPSEPASFISENNTWIDDALLDGIPKIKSDSLTVRKYVSTSGRQIIIRVENMTYAEYLKYLKKLEKAGFEDNNNRANVPEDAPLTVAMFYSAFDGKRAFVADWNGENSSAAFDFELCVYNFNPVE